MAPRLLQSYLSRPQVVQTNEADPHHSRDADVTFAAADARYSREDVGIIWPIGDARWEHPPPSGGVTVLASIDRWASQNSSSAASPALRPSPSRLSDRTNGSSQYPEDGSETRSAFDDASPEALALEERRRRASVDVRDGKLEESYEVLSELGRGSFGVVVEARCKRTGLVCAVKTITCGQDADGRKRFQYELSIARRLAHPYIVRLHEALRQGETYHLVMDLCKGGTLHERLQGVSSSSFPPRSPVVAQAGLPEDVSSCGGSTAELPRQGAGLPPWLVQMYAWQMLTGVAYLHHHRYAHRDIKADNYLLETKAEDSPLRLTDFGLSKHFGPVGRMFSKVGTPYTTAPEVFAGSYDERCDVWSVGVVCYLACVGYPPFQGERPEETERLVRHGELRFNPDDWRWHPPEVQNLIKKLLTRDPAARPSAKKVLQDNAWLWPHGRTVPASAKRPQRSPGRCCVLS